MCLYDNINNKNFYNLYKNFYYGQILYRILFFNKEGYHKIVLYNCLLKTQHFAENNFYV
jgi:hypothetical protein